MPSMAVTRHAEHGARQPFRVARGCTKWRARRLNRSLGAGLKSRKRKGEGEAPPAAGPDSTKTQQ